MSSEIFHGGMDAKDIESANHAHYKKKQLELRSYLFEGMKVYRMNIKTYELEEAKPTRFEEAIIPHPIAYGQTMNVRRAVFDYDPDYHYTSAINKKNAVRKICRDTGLPIFYKNGKVYSVTIEL